MNASKGIILAGLLAGTLLVSLFMATRVQRVISEPIARLDAPTSIRERVSTGRSRIVSGKSHSCEMPTRLSAAPSAHTISVAEGRSETIRGMRDRGAIQPPAFSSA